MKHSIVIPIYNDQAVVDAFYARLAKVLADHKDDFEIIFVDDASVDDTYKRLLALRSRDPRVKVLRMSRNFGHQPSLLAGHDYATGDTVITLDSDLQHPPELLPKLIEHHREGYDVVYTVRKNNPYGSFLASLFSKAFYKLFNAVSRLGIDPGIADFRLLSRRAVKVFCELREAHRFNRGLVSWLGFRQLAVPYEAEERHAGQSKFYFRKKLGFALDGLFSFSILPLRLTALSGALLALASIVYGASVVITKLSGEPWPPGWATLTAAVTFLGGLQLFSSGILGEYIGRIYQETKMRPLYVIAETPGFDRAQD